MPRTTRTPATAPRPNRRRLAARRTVLALVCAVAFMIVGLLGVSAGILVPAALTALAQHSAR